MTIFRDNFRDLFQQASLQIFMGFVQQFRYQRIYFRLHVCRRIRMPGRSVSHGGSQGIGTRGGPKQRGIKGRPAGGGLNSVQREIGLSRLTKRIVFVIRPDVQLRFTVMSEGIAGRIEKWRIVFWRGMSRK